MGTPFVLMNFALLGWFYGRAAATTGMVLQILIHGVNIVLSVAFVQGLGWGVAGVALATVLGEVAAVAVGLALVVRHFGGLKPIAALVRWRGADRSDRVEAPVQSRARSHHPHAAARNRLCLFRRPDLAARRCDARRQPPAAARVDADRLFPRRAGAGRRAIVRQGGRRQLPARLQPGAEADHRLGPRHRVRPVRFDLGLWRLSHRFHVDQRGGADRRPCQSRLCRAHGLYRHPALRVRWRDPGRDDECRPSATA